MSAAASAIRVPFSPLNGGEPGRREAIEAAVRRVLASGRFILGQEVAAFEREFSRYLDVAHVVGCASGTDAISLALSAAGARAGDGVVIPANACVPVAAGARLAGTIPVLADVDPETLTLDAGSTERALAGRADVRFVLAVHLYGGVADVEGLGRICSDRGLTLIEDCAQSHGARANGRSTAGFGAAAAFSFYPTKNLGACGDGGAVATSDDGIGVRLRLLRQYGWSRRDHSEMEGRNSRLDEVQAAILRTKLPWLDRDNDRRRRIAARYDDAFEDLPVRRLSTRPGTLAVRHLYPVRTPRREELRRFLSERGIETGVHYPVALHLQPAYAFLGYRRGDFPVAEEACETVLSLPIAPALSDEQIDLVIASVREFFV